MLTRAPSVPPGIAAEVAAAGGRVTFARFMELALTHPLEGYYSRTARLLGPRGHFSTAPRLAPTFNQAVCRLVEELVDELGGATDGAQTSGPGGRAPLVLVELGAGEGDLAKAVLREWDLRRGDLRQALRYSLVELAGPLRARQLQAVSRALRRGWQVGWADTVGEALGAGVVAAASVVVGNEFIDALPIHIVDVGGTELQEVWVELAPAPFGGAVAREVLQPLSPEAAAEAVELFGGTDPAGLRSSASDGVIELRPAAGALLRELAETAGPICLLTIDYGEWYAAPSAGRKPSPGSGPDPRLPLRKRSVRGYYRHQTVLDPYIRVGRQDLTADVDFGALDLHGRALGFETVLFTTLSGLLRANGGEGRLRYLLARAGDSGPGALAADREATVLQALLDEAGVGGAFKVMLQVRE